MKSLGDALKKKEEVEAFPSEKIVFPQSDGKMRYIFITYDGYPLPMAKQLIDEGNDVWVGQVMDNKDLHTESGVASDEDKETKRRRLSLYEGILVKHDAKKLIKAMASIENKDDYFVIFDFNNLWRFSEEVLDLGFTKGFFPLEEDFELEKDRQLGKDIVEEYFPKLKVAPVHQFNDIDDAIGFLNENEGVYALKSDGNFADTTVPLTNNTEFAKNELIRELTKNREGWEKGFTLEEKIVDATEFAPQIVFWNGEPLYYCVDMETRLIGSGDVGFQTGGIQNVIIATEPDDKINEVFPDWVYERMKDRVGMTIFDAGILMDKKGDMYFTEFAGNRWGWGGALSELSMARKGDRCASEYFEAIARGENPQKYKFGTCLSLYNIKADKEVLGCYKEGIPIQWDGTLDPYLFLYQIKKEPEDEEVGIEEQVVNVGYTNNLLGYVTGCGDTFEEAIDSVYEFTKDKMAFNGIYYRPKLDWVSYDYVSSLPNRFARLNHEYFEAPDMASMKEYETDKRLNSMREKLDKLYGQED